MVHIAVCDDEEKYLLEIKFLLESWSILTSTEVKITSFSDCDSLIQANNSNRYDIIFLDIIMPWVNGIQAAKELRSKDKITKIVFLTSSLDFAFESYSVKATDYCLKPISYDRLKEIMDECIKLNYKEPDNLVIKTVGGYQKIYLYDIEYIEAQNKRVFFHLKSEKIIEVIQPLYTFEKYLSDTKGFFKCHRSYLVYLYNIDYFSKSEIKTKSGKKIPIARGYGRAFLDAYFSAIFKE